MEQIHGVLPAGWEQDRVIELNQTAQGGSRKAGKAPDLLWLLAVLLPVAGLIVFHYWIGEVPEKPVELPMPESKAVLLRMCVQAGLVPAPTAAIARPPSATGSVYSPYWAVPAVVPTPTPAMYWPGQSPGFRP